ERRSYEDDPRIARHAAGVEQVVIRPPQGVYHLLRPQAARVLAQVRGTDSLVARAPDQVPGAVLMHVVADAVVVVQEGGEHSYVGMNSSQYLFGKAVSVDGENEVGGEGRDLMPQVPHVLVGDRL